MVTVIIISACIVGLATWVFVWLITRPERPVKLKMSAEDLELALRDEHPLIPQIALKDKEDMDKHYQEFIEWYSANAAHTDVWPVLIFPYWLAIVKNKSGDKRAFEKWYRQEGDPKADIWANWEYWVEHVKNLV